MTRRFRRLSYALSSVICHCATFIQDPYQTRREDAVPVETPEEEPLGRDVGGGLEEVMGGGAGEGDQSAEEVFGDLAEVDDLLADVDRDGVGADDDEEEGPAAELQDVDRRIEEGQQQQAQPSGEQDVRAGPDIFDDREGEGPPGRRKPRLGPVRSRRGRHRRGPGPCPSRCGTSGASGQPARPGASCRWRGAWRGAPRCRRGRSRGGCAASPAARRGRCGWAGCPRR